MCDKAHKMSATFTGGEIRYTKRYRLGQLLGVLTPHLLLLTAIPQNANELERLAPAARLRATSWCSTVPPASRGRTSSSDTPRATTVAGRSPSGDVSPYRRRDVRVSSAACSWKTDRHETNAVYKASLHRRPRCFLLADTLRFRGARRAISPVDIEYEK